MCDTTTLVRIPVWWEGDFDPTHPEYALDDHGNRCFRIDTCIVPALIAVWKAGFKTLGCCCGHGSGRGVISLDLGWNHDSPTPPHHCVLCGVFHEAPEGT